MTFDLSSVANYPPSVYPAYYYPTTASGNNPEGIRITITALSHSSVSMSLHLDIRGGSDFSSTISLTQLYYAQDGTPLPAPGTNFPVNWTPVTVNWNEIFNAPMTGTLFRKRIDLDFCFKAEADDTPTGTAGVSTTLYIRYYGL